MIYVKQEITAFTASNIVDTVATYSASTNYAIGAYARFGNFVYKSTATPNINHQPDTNIGVYWLEWSPSNTYALLDLEQDTVTTWEGDGVVSFSRGSKDSLGIGNYNASDLTIDYLDASNNVVLTQTFHSSKNISVFDAWSYGYGDFILNIEGTRYVPLKRVGTTIRVTLKATSSGSSCGFLVGGKAVSAGKTMNGVASPDRRIGSKTVSVATFQTVLNKVDLMRVTLEAKKIINDPMMFVVDESENSKHNNMIILGKIKKCDANATLSPKNFISWEVEQFIKGIE